MIKLTIYRIEAIVSAFEQKTDVALFQNQLGAFIYFQLLLTNGVYRVCVHNVNSIQSK